jgi:hypothetical protein
MKVGDKVRIIGAAQAYMWNYSKEGIIVDYRPEHDGAWPFHVPLKNTQGDLVPFAFGRDELEVI